MTQSLYFLAILPDKPLRNSVLSLKEEISKEYHAKHALKSPAHITLQMPFKRDSSFEKLLIPKLAEFASTQHSFDVQLKGYGAFAPKVLYINIADHSPFISIHKQLTSLLLNDLDFPQKELSQNIHPHMTLAHRDLSSNEFGRAWREFKPLKFEAQFEAQGLCLLKHNSKSWDIYKEFPFKRC